MTREEYMSLTVAFGKQAAEVSLPAAATLGDLGDELARLFGVAPHTIKLFLQGSKGALKVQEQAGVTLADAGIHQAAKLKMLASRAADVDAVREAREDSRAPSFEHELRRELRRAGAAPAQPQPPAGQHTFQRYEVWQRPGLTPPPGEALKLLHRLAADPGIQGVMVKHSWSVGLLSEMPPEGKVGVSAVCILGVNINRGQEISLRLRTDDLRGFRRYDRIRETLLHELAHMVHGDHDNAFKELNSQLRRECDALDWRGAAARSVAGPAFEGSVHYDLPPERPQTAMQHTASSSGSKLGGSQPAAAADPKLAAAEAALRRAGVVADANAPPDVAAAAASSLQAVMQQYSKGQGVMYRQRDGTWTEAKIAAIDYSVLPPSIGIEIGGSYRETEATRLQPLSLSGDGAGQPQQQPQQQQQEAEAVQGLGHRDAATEAKEAAAQALER